MYWFICIDINHMYWFVCIDINHMYWFICIDVNHMYWFICIDINHMYWFICVDFNHMYWFICIDVNHKLCRETMLPRDQKHLMDTPNFKLFLELQFKRIIVCASYFCRFRIKLQWYLFAITCFASAFVFLFLHLRYVLFRGVRTFLQALKLDLVSLAIVQS